MMILLITISNAAGSLLKLVYDVAAKVGKKLLGDCCIDRTGEFHCDLVVNRAAFSVSWLYLPLRN